MTVAGVPVRFGRVVAAAGLAVIVLLPLNGAAAEPQPTIAQARARLEKLNDLAGKIVDRYNLANERWKKIKKDYDRLNKDYKQQQKTVDLLRGDLVRLAINTYQYGGMSSGRIVTSDDPRSVLSGMALFDHMAADRAESLRTFETANQALKDKYGKAKETLAEAGKARDALAEEKAKAERMVAQQTKLLRRLGQFRAGDPNSPGIAYTGPASGNARLVLQFAYKQIGKPYRWGATGPSSYDCSGFSQAAWRQAGVELPRTTYEQWSWGADRRVPLDLSQLQPGDLLFSKGLGHMGIYAGDGKMVHAPQTGDVVKVVELDGYWWGRLQGAIRP
ncbi:C40 family peptidase [Microbispora sp. H10836]|uniref:C40 family peptidase n=1 Tax=Microbispora sp. H10836 TaxID=2729106 RepID=UPI0014751A74|nr:C40 family peptidase [Microbispora sp. H10836]